MKLVMKCLLLLSAFLILDVHSPEVCVNTNSVSVFFLADAKNFCPLKSITARCVVNSTQIPAVIIWECDGQDGSKEESNIICNSPNVPFPLNCKEGSVQPTLVSCTCDNYTITSDATFLATTRNWTLTCIHVNFSNMESSIQKNVSFGIEDPLTPYTSVVKKSSFGDVTFNWTASGIAQYQYIVSVSSPNSPHLNRNFTTSITTISVNLEISVNYSITVTAERCDGSVRSNTSEPLYIMITPDVKTDSSLTGGAVAGIVIGVLIMIIIIAIIVAVIFYSRRNTQVRDIPHLDTEYLLKSVPEDRVAPNEDSSIDTSRDLRKKNNVIRGLCVTAQYIYYSSHKEIEGGTEYSVQIVKKENLKHIIRKQTGFELARGIATDTKGCIYVSDSGRNRIMKYDEALLECTPLLRKIKDFIPYGIVVTEQYVLVCNCPHNEIHILDHELKLCYVITSEYLNQPTDIAFDGSRFYVTNSRSVAVIRIDFTGKSYSVKKIPKMSVGNNNDQHFHNLRGICTHDGYLYITERHKDGRILCLKYEDPITLRLVKKICGQRPVVIAQYDGDIYYSREDERSNFDIFKITHDDFEEA